MSRCGHVVSTLLFVSTLLVLVTAVAPASAAPLRIVEVRAPDVNCVFDADCRITVGDSVGEFAVPAASGRGRLQSRTYPPGEAGTPGAGLHPFVYRVDLTQVTGLTALVCVDELRLPFGPVEALDYDGDGRADHVWVVTRGGLGSVRPGAADLSGAVLTFEFSPAVCPGSRPGDGETSFFFGLASRTPPTEVEASVGFNAGPDVTTAARAPQGALRSGGAGKLTVLTLAEIETFEPDEDTGPIVLHVTHQELIGAMEGGEFRRGPAPDSTGFDVVTLSRGYGHLVVPRCGLCEQLWPTSERTLVCAPQRRPIPGCGPTEPQTEQICSWVATGATFGRCSGLCGFPDACREVWYWNGLGGGSMRCECVDLTVDQDGR